MYKFIYPTIRLQFLAYKSAHFFLCL